MQGKQPAKVIRPKMFDLPRLFHLFFGLVATVVSGYALEHFLMPQYVQTGEIVLVTIYATFAATIIISAWKRCRKQVYEQAVNAEAAVLTKDKLKSLRLGHRG